MKGRIRVGMSGWTYEPWRGDFYPKGLTQKKELEYAAGKVTSIEVNGTFYSLQKPESFQSWADQVPEDFCFAVKAPQFMTHVLRLKEPAEPLANFLASGLFKLGPKLGPILWQLPPNVILKDDRFEKFFKMLPHDSKAAAKVAKGHGKKVAGRACLEPGGDYPVRHAFEFRHPSFNHPDFLAQMKEYGVCAVIGADGEKSAGIQEPTTDFVYVRLHGEDKKFKKGYTPAAIQAWAKKAKAWAADGLDVFVYFSTDAKEYSPFDAMNLLKALKK
ncbi:MAG TPA: DUF72 domain-containing protein [Bdellovibrionota bacterium]|jgi:uncharacterized protein YecE (DUF72 family)|nr:DUF72 domain-containing protein [Bdellovibrionota bacterium]